MLGERSDQRGLWEADRLYLDHVGRESFYGLLASLRGRLFRDAEFAEFYCPDNGRDSVPPSLLATALLLQSHDKVSDAEAKARADFDLRWKVALGIEAEDRPFAKSTLQVFRAQLILHDKVREVFESSLRLARESGCLKGRGMRVALDTTNILGRGAVRDTYNLLADGIVKLLRALAAVEQAPVSELAQARGYERYLGSSVKGEAAIDWADRQARAALLAGIVADADRLLELSRQAQRELPEDSDERQRIVAAAELLGQLLLQDVERAEGGVSLKDGVSRDRMMSVHDPEMRHGHKSSSRRFDGHKAAIVVDTDSQLITAVDVLPGNAPDNLGALELVEESEGQHRCVGGRGHGRCRLRRRRYQAGLRRCGPHPDCQGAGASQPDPLFRKRTSILTWRRVLAPVRRGMLPGRWCRRDGAPAKRVGLTVWRPSDSTRRSAGYAPCGPSAWRQNRVRDERCNCTRRKRCYSRPAPCSRARPLSSTGSAAWWWSTGWRGWSNWESASLATSAASKPGSSCTWRPRWPNLTLVATKAGMTGGTGSGPSAGSAQVAGMVNSATAWLGQIWTLTLLVSALLTKSLFPIRGFRPGF